MASSTAGACHPASARARRISASCAARSPRSAGSRSMRRVRIALEVDGSKSGRMPRVAPGTNRIENQPGSTSAGVGIVKNAM